MARRKSALVSGIGALVVLFFIAPGITERMHAKANAAKDRSNAQLFCIQTFKANHLSTNVLKVEVADGQADVSAVTNGQRYHCYARRQGEPGSNTWTLAHQ